MAKKSQGKFLKENVDKRNAQRYPAAAPATRKQQIAKSVLVFTVLTLCVGLVTCAFFMSKLGVSISLPSKTIATGVKIAGVDVGGLKKNEAADTVAERIGDSYSTTPMVVTVLDKQLEIAPSVSGAELDVNAAVKAALSYGTQENPAKNVDITPYLNLNEEAIQQQIQTFAAQFPSEGSSSNYEILTETVDGKETGFLAVTIGKEHYDFDADAVYDTVLKAYNNHRFETSYTCTLVMPTDIDLDAIFAQTSIEPVNASWDAEEHKIIESVTGYCFDLEAAKEAVANASTGDVLKFPFQEILPEIDTETMEASLFRDELATYTSKASSSYNRDNNLKLACEALDGLILYPGDTFGYNATLGERTEEKGYKPAASYMGNDTIMTFGGGICQPSSTLYYCVLMADLEVVQRHSHTFISSYVPYGMDATVDWEGPDFKFRNNTNYPLRIDAHADGGSVTVTLVGTDEKDYYVKMEYEILGMSYCKTVEEEVTADSGFKDGEVKVTPYTGYTIQTYKCKYDKQTDELISREEEAYSVYSKRDQVVYKVVDSTEPTEPDVTEPTDPTEPKPTDPQPTEPKPTDPKPTEPQPTEPQPTEPKPTRPTDPIGEAGGDAALPSE